jgi:hypothetical protein
LKTTSIGILVSYIRGTWCNFTAANIINIFAPPKYFYKKIIFVYFSLNNIQPNGVQCCIHLRFLRGDERVVVALCMAHGSRNQRKNFGRNGKNLGKEKVITLSDDIKEGLPLFG